MPTRWTAIEPRGIEIVHTHTLVARGFGMILLLAGLAMMVVVIGGQMRQPDGPTLSAGLLGMILFALGFTAVGAWAVGYRGLRRLDAASNVYHESASIFGIRRGHERPLADYCRLIRVRKDADHVQGTQSSHDLYLFASQKDWTVLITTYDNLEAYELGQAVGEVLQRPMEEMSQGKWDKLAS